MLPHLILEKCCHHDSPFLVGETEAQIGLNVASTLREDCSCICIFYQEGECLFFCLRRIEVRSMAASDMRSSVRGRKGEVQASCSVTALRKQLQRRAKHYHALVGKTCKPVKT